MSNDIDIFSDFLEEIPIKKINKKEMLANIKDNNKNYNKEYEEESTQIDCNLLFNNQKNDEINIKFINFLKIASEKMYNMLKESTDVIVEEKSVKISNVHARSLLSSLLLKNQKEKILISDVDIMANNLVISFYQDNHSLPCSHTSHIYFLEHKFLKNSFKLNIKKKVETSSCISCICCLDKSFLAGTFLGEILLYFYDSDNDKLQTHTVLSNNKAHNDKIVSIKFSKTMNKFLSISSDGILYIWELNSVRLEDIESNRESNISLSKIIAGFNIRFKNTKIKNPLQINPYCMELYQSEFLQPISKSSDKEVALVGCLDGSIYRLKIDLAVFNQQKISNTMYDEEVNSIFSYLKQEDVLEIRKNIEKFTDTNLTNQGIFSELGLKDLSKYNIDITKYMKQNIIELNYEKHYLGVCNISSSKNDLFFSSSNDGSFRLYDKQGKCLNICNLDEKEKFTFVLYSKLVKGLLIAGASSGSIYFYSQENTLIHLINKEVRTTQSPVKRIVEINLDDDQNLKIFVVNDNSNIECLELNIINNLFD